nr:DUF5131 family protein [Leptospira santarosai]
MDGIDWCIVGGESGPKARPMKQEWVEEVLAICDKNSIPFFFKQWGGRHKKQNGRTLNGRSYDGYPRKKTVQRNVIHLELAIDFIFWSKRYIAKRLIDNLITSYSYLEVVFS